MYNEYNSELMAAGVSGHYAYKIKDGRDNYHVVRTGNYYNVYRDFPKEG